MKFCIKYVSTFLLNNTNLEEPNQRFASLVSNAPNGLIIQPYNREICAFCKTLQTNTSRLVPTLYGGLA